MKTPPNKMKRQLRYLAERIAGGKCATCGKDRTHYATRCNDCAEKARQAQRLRYRTKHGLPLDAPVKRTKSVRCKMEGR